MDLCLIKWNISRLVYVEKFGQFYQCCSVAIMEVTTVELHFMPWH